MLLTIDIGNTNITLGLYEGEELCSAWRLATVHDRMPDEYGLQLLGLIEQAGRALDQIEASVLASVVPPLTGTFLQACEKYLKQTPLVVDAGVRTGLRIRYEDPKHALGADRVVDAVAVQHHYGVPACVVDFGTATTFDAISSDGEYLGGAIAAWDWDRCGCTFPTNCQVTACGTATAPIGHRIEHCSCYPIRSDFWICEFGGRHGVEISR